MYVAIEFVKALVKSECAKFLTKRNVIAFINVQLC